MGLRKLLLVGLVLLVGCQKEKATAELIALKITQSVGGTVLGAGQFEAGSRITVTAQPNDNYLFSGWSNGSTANPLEITLNNPLTLMAFFEKKQFSLTLNTVGGGEIVKSVVTSGRTPTNHTVGSVIQLRAVPITGWVFSHWSESVSSTANPVEITMNQHISATAHFSRDTNNETSSNATILSANGPGATYEEITAVLAPGYNPVEPPDCNHTDFGRHIDEIFDDQLNQFVFQFHIHVSPDNDRCINFDRQRNEIKTYDKSPENLLGREGETVTYRWKFKLPEGFRSSPKFTHIHQLKSVGGDYNSMPMYTLTTRSGSPDRLELRYAEVDQQVTLDQIPIAPLIDRWVEVTATIEYGMQGSYSLRLVDALTAEVFFEYNNASIVNWREGGSFVRPKWGVYRSLVYPEYLRDEQVLFADFSIGEE